MKTLREFLVLAVLLCSPAYAESIDGIQVENAYAYATTSVQKNGAAFFVANNGSESDTRIIGASADISERVELHTHTMDGEVMMMREVEGYDVPAGGSVTLEPMGHHIMFMGLKSPLEAGSTFPLTLTFSDEREIVVDVEIKNPGDAE